MRPWRILPRHLALIALAGAAGLTWATPPSLAAPVAGAAKAKAKAAAPAESSDGRITLDFVEADLNDVAKALSVQSGMNIALSTQAKGKITLRLRHTTLEEALRFVSRLSSLDYRRFDDTYVIGTAEELRSMAARAGVTDTWAPRRLKPEQAQTLVRAALPYVTVQAVPDSRHVLLLGSHEDLASARRLLDEADASAVIEKPTAAQPEAHPSVTRIYQLRFLHPRSALGTILGTDAEGKTLEAGKGLFPDLKVSVGPEPFAPNPANFSPLSIETRSVFAAQSVQSNKDSNGMGTNGQTKARTLILSGPADQVTSALELLQSLDVAPPQVQIEAKLVDISPEKFRELGIEYDWTSVSWLEGPLRTDGRSGTVDAGDRGGAGLRFGRFFRTPFDLTSLLKALETSRVGKLLANPKISVVDSEDASIFIGDLLRYRVLQSVTAGGSEQFTVETVPVGVALLVRPRVHDDSEITLKVHPVVSTVTAFVGPERIPQTASREADTTFRMRDGETIAIGGLLREEDLSIVRKVPLLGDLPILGELFKSRTNNKKKSEVTVFLTARILKS
jgi:type II secretory pathway component GspD/PulD (secretin)